MQMIGDENFCLLKTFEVVLTNLRRRWDEVIHESHTVQKMARPMMKWKE